MSQDWATTKKNLQICLSYFGIRSRIALEALLYIGLTLVDCGQHREAETILCLWVQLESEMSAHADRDTIDAQNVIRGMTILAYSLTRQRRYEDNKSALNTTEIWFKDLIRVDSPSCWHYFRQKVLVLKSEGRLLESEEILRAVLKHTPDYSDYETMLTMKHLADLLEETGQQAERTTLREKVFVMREKIYGIQSQYSRWDCWKLGLCYAEQGRYEEATVHFQQTIEKLAICNDGDLDSRVAYIEELRGWISELERVKAEASILDIPPVL